jgi:murein DD-endopeptidase MepM/ murein hydrolase activator NlpD
MKLESDGVWQTSPAGAIGYMQVMPFWGPDLGLNLNDHYQNILAGAKVLKSYLDQNGGNFYEALRGYHGYGDDGYTNDRQYADIVTGNYQQLLNGGGVGAIPVAGGIAQAAGLSTIWGGQGSFPITQDMGLTDFAQGNSLYDYARAYHGFQGHPGLDIGTPSGTKLYTPVSGTVKFAGGSGYYANYGDASPGHGEFRIVLDNGDELILGHMSQINLRPGDRVNAGTLVGLSGGENGDHVHVEYRKSDGQGGFYIADPRQVLSGGAVALTGSPAYSNSGAGYAPAPTSFADFWMNQYGR